MNVPPNPIVDEVRANREAICAEYGNDLDRIFEALRALEQEHPERLVTLRRHAISAAEPADLSSE